MNTKFVHDLLQDAKCLPGKSESLLPEFFPGLPVLAAIVSAFLRGLIQFV